MRVMLKALSTTRRIRSVAMKGDDKRVVEKQG